MHQLFFFMALLLFAASAGAARLPFDPNEAENISYENVREYAYTNADIVKKPVRGIYINFHGAGFTGTIDEDTPFAKALAEAGVAEIFPYGDRYCLMNEKLAEQVEYIVDIIRKELKAPDSVPVAFGGGSMGGLAALTFGVFSNIKPVCVLANCPNTDLYAREKLRPETAEQHRRAFRHTDLPWDTVLRIHSPRYLINRLPETDYLFLSGDNDPVPGLSRDTEILARLLKKRGDRVAFYSGPIGHCNATEEMTLAWNRFLYEHLGVDAPDNPYKSWR